MPISAPMPNWLPSSSRGDALTSTPAAATSREARRRRRQEALGDRAIHEQRLERVAHRRALGLGVEHDGGGHLGIGVRVDEDVDDALVVLEHGHARALGDPAYELLAAARDDEVDVPVLLEHGRHRLAIGDVDELDRLGRRAGLLERLGQHGRDEGVGLDRLAAAAEQHRIARLHAETGRVGGDVGPRLVDEGDDAEGHAHAGDLDAVGPPPRLRDGADRIGQRGDLAQAVGHLLDAGLAERESVEEGARQAPSPRALQVGAVGLEEGRRLLLQRARHVRQRLVLHARAAERERVGGLARGARFRFDQLPDVHAGSFLNGGAATAAPPRHPPNGITRDRPVALVAYKITRLSRWITSSKLLYPRRAAMSRVLAPRIRRSSPASKLTSPRANSRPSPTSATTSPAAKSPSTSTTPEGSRLFP